MKGMRGAAAKDFRRQANKVAAQTLETMRPPVEAALRNEHVTRLRVDALEKGLEAEQSRVDALVAVRYRTLGGRLRWLLLGR